MIISVDHHYGLDIIMLYFQFVSEVFPRRNSKRIQETLEQFSNVMQTSHRELEKIRESLLQMKNQTQCQPKKILKVISALHSPDYFREVESESCIASTVMTSTTWQNAKKILNDRHYDVMSNDCKLLQKTIKDGIIKNVNQRYVGHYKGSCGPSYTPAWQGAPLSMEALNVGMPTFVNQTEEKVHLSFIHVIRNGMMTSHGDVATGSSNIVIPRCGVRFQYKPGMTTKKKKPTTYFTIS